MIKTLKAKVKKLILKILGKVSHLKVEVKCKHVWYGNNYGGFYVCPKFLNQNSIVYSFGIGEDISFDKAIIENHNCNVFGFDPTPKSIYWTKEQNLPSKFKFFDFGISNRNGFVDFYLPKNAEHVSGSIIVQNNINVREKVSARVKSIQAIINELGHKHIDVLKMDIEGAEYDVIESIFHDNISIAQILIEFHDRLVKNGKLKTREAIRKLHMKGYEISCSF